MRPRILLFLCAVPLVAGCVARTLTYQEVPASPETGTVRAASRAHLVDGSMVVLRQGFTIQGDSLTGFGIRYGVTRRDSMPFTAVPLDSVAGIEAYEEGVNAPATVALSILGTAAGVLGGAILAVAIFGSCPTFYADSAGTWVLEAEGFSYSIARLFEARDVDQLRTVRAGDSIIRIELRNEAAETHYINQLALLAVTHTDTESALPDPVGAPVAIGPVREAVMATDRSGQDLRPALGARDGVPVETHPTRLARASAADPADHIELLFTGLAGRDSVALVLTARSSLFTTVLLYDVMLGGQGPRAVEWIASDIERIDQGVTLGDWYHRVMGLRVSVAEHGAWRHVAWVGDPGPIAWKDMAVMLPAAGDKIGRAHV